MSVTGLGTRQKRARIPLLGLVSAGLFLTALLLLAVELTHFAQDRDKLQTDIKVAGIPVGGLNLREAVTTWSSVYMQRVELDYLNNPIVLNPADIGFNIKNELMLGEVQSKISSSNYWVDFWNYLWRRPSTPVTVALNADYDKGKLRSFLQDIATRYDQPAGSAKVDPDTMVFGSGVNGLRLDVEKSMDAIDKVLRQPTGRKIKLVMHNENAQNANLDTLKDAIVQYLNTKGFVPDGKTTTASIVVIDLETGQEMSINPDVAYSGMSTIKIPILINIFGRIQTAIDDQIKWLMGASILCSSNDASDYLIQIAGNNNMGNGLDEITKLMPTLGAKNTFLTAPLFIDPNAKPFSIPSPKTAPNPNFNTKPDLWNQTTAEDMATLLQELYDCSEYNSGLHAAFPAATSENSNIMYDQRKCRQMVELLSGNTIGRLIELGIPAGTRLARKNGWGVVQGGQNASDAGIVYSPGRRYILVAYLWQQLNKGDDTGNMVPWESIEGVSRLVYNYFNTDKPMVVARVPENKTLALGCVMPNKDHLERLSLDNINNGRFDANGNIEPDACYDFPHCKTKDTSAQPTPSDTSTGTGGPQPPTPPATTAPKP